MACVYQKGKESYVVQVTLRGEKKKFYGFKNRRQAEQFGEKVDLLIAVVETGCENPDSARWVKSLADADSSFYPKLEKLGLVPPRAVVGTVAEMIELFLKNIAVREKWIAENPFAHRKGGNVVNTERQFFITQEMAAKVTEACPNAYWRLIFALGRYGGLRIPSELVYLKWSDILWDQGKIRISIPKKTGKNEVLETRYLPLFKELFSALLEYSESLPDGHSDAMFSITEGDKTLRRGLERIIQRTGLEQWEKLFINLRSTRQTELLRQYPVHQVCAWIGNSPAVMFKHYAQVTDEDYRQASYLTVAASESVSLAVAS